MNVNLFESKVKELDQHCMKLLVNKAKEYSSDEDRLANFKMPTSITGETPAKICWGYDMKHICSIQKIIEEIEAGGKIDLELAKEKLGDYINYGYILWAILNEMSVDNPAGTEYNRDINN